MYHYKFTNDLRISTLEASIIDAAQKVVTDTVPTAAEDKSANNNIMTLMFYFNLHKGSACAKVAADGNVRKVVLNFIRKFQFPNMRTKESFELAYNDNIKLVPMRLILKLLYISLLSDGENGYITRDEIKNFIFYNETVAKVINPDVVKLYSDIKEYRNTSILPTTIETNYANIEWKQDERQIREMVKILLWSGCVVQDEYERLKIKHSTLNRSDEADIFEIITEQGFWNGEVWDSEGQTLRSYKDYMDIKEADDTAQGSPIEIERDIPFYHNRIVFGAPGTGKSYRLEDDRKRYFTNDHMERVTFHPNYSYSNFVGTYKPVMDGKDITYKYVPGPFIRTLVKALRNPQENYLLLIEEINRANVAGVFGDVFQLLDRKNGISEYPIETSEDLKQFLFDELEVTYEKVIIPNNMYLWSTMNSADQGVFPMDTAFKRRWNFEYIGINEGSAMISSYNVPLGNTGVKVNWDELRRGINNKLINECRINEDKLIGPFFLGLDVLNDISKFNAAFISKVLMYLYEDAAKQAKGKFFSGCSDSSTYSKVRDEFMKKGEKIFSLNLERINEFEENDEEHIEGE